MSSITSRLALVFGAALAIAACRDANLVSPEAHPHSTVPSARLLGNPIVAITAGDFHTCIRFYLGAVSCWGINDDGELGIGASPSICSSQNLGWGHKGPPFGCATTPVTIPNLSFSTVSAGMNHSCGIRYTDHTAWCWGANSAFQLGTGDNKPSNTPRQIALQSAFSSISAGLFESCGTVDGTWPQGSLFCWGQNQTGSQPYFLAPTVISPPAGVPDDFHGVTVGENTVCAFWTDNSTSQLFCMGDNTDGKAGVDPKQFSNVGLTAVQQLTPASSGESGLWSSCVDQAGGGVACWGDNGAGELGNSQASNPSFVPVPVSTPVPLHGVVGTAVYACALDASGNAWCWGLHSFDGTTTRDPAMLPTGHTYIALAAGTQHVCGIGTDKHVWCWGDNTLGQLGNGQPGTSAPASQPAQVSGT